MQLGKGVNELSFWYPAVSGYPAYGLMMRRRKELTDDVLARSQHCIVGERATSPGHSPQKTCHLAIMADETVAFYCLAIRQSTNINIMVPIAGTDIRKKPQKASKSHLSRNQTTTVVIAA